MSRLVDPAFGYDTAFGVDRMEAYERVLAGSRALFAHQDSVEHASRVVMPAAEHPAPTHEYQPGTSGPAEAARLVAGGWHNLE